MGNATGVSGGSVGVGAARPDPIELATRLKDDDVNTRDWTWGSTYLIRQLVV